MDEDQALEAVRIFQPKLVIPMHYACPFLFTKNGNPADDQRFKSEVERLGAECRILGKGESLVV
jgi:L-ascorbate metabolism protein UlaG (beta-lactamase superfamily)